jgi:hypothetical protein
MITIEGRHSEFQEEELGVVEHECNEGWFGIHAQHNENCSSLPPVAFKKWSPVPTDSPWAHA